MNFRTIAPEKQTLKDFKLPHFKVKQLENKQLFYWLPYGNQDLVFLNIIFEAGSWQERQKYSAVFLPSMFFEGTHTKNQRQIRQLFDYYGASCNAQAGNHIFTLQLSCLSKHLDILLNQIIDLLHNCNFPLENWTKQVMIKLDNLKYQQAKTNYLAHQKFFKAFYTPQHPYYKFYDLESLKNFNLNYLQKHYQSYIVNAPFEVILAGGLTEDNLRSIERQLGNINITKVVPDLAPYLNNHNESKTYYIEKKRALQTSIRIGKYLKPMSKSDEMTFKMLTTTLGGYFGSRLMTNLREDKGYTYGVYCQSSFLLKTRFLTIAGDFIKERREQVLSEIEREIENLKTRLIEKEELDRVKNYMAGQYLKSFNTPTDLIRHLKMCLHFGLDQHYRDKYISKLQAITAEDLRDSAQQHLTDNWLKVMVG